ncbi:hypothetical protein NKH77_24175 [Streptomyces sp. M19]
MDADAAEILAATQRLLREATASVDVVLASEAAHVDLLHSVLDGWLPADGQDVATRVLCAQNTLDWDFVRRHVKDGGPVEVRVARIPLLAAIVVDDRAALVCADSAVGRRASAIRDRGVIATLKALFDGIWRGALVVDERIDFGDRARTEMVRPILEWLRLGSPTRSPRDNCPFRYARIAVTWQRSWPFWGELPFSSGGQGGGAGTAARHASRDPPPARR